jgi:hypothetical protein
MHRDGVAVGLAQDGDREVCVSLGREARIRLLGTTRLAEATKVRHAVPRLALEYARVLLRR